MGKSFQVYKGNLSDERCPIPSFL